MNNTLLTIGHSTHAIEAFVRPLVTHQISAIADVRSRPYSRMNPQFNREGLKAGLKTVDIAYAFLGRELGARTDDRSCYVDGKVQYERLAQTSLFQEGIARISDGVQTHRIAAAVCRERPDYLPPNDPRLPRVTQAQTPITITHILADGTLETNADAERRLLNAVGLPERDLFTTVDEFIEEAYRRQEERIAWIETAGDSVGTLEKFADAGTNQ